MRGLYTFLMVLALSQHHIERLVFSDISDQEC